MFLVIDPSSKTIFIIRPHLPLSHFAQLLSLLFIKFFKSFNIPSVVSTYLPDFIRPPVKINLKADIIAREDIVNAKPLISPATAPIAV